jgi:hypothetical protein
LATNNQLRLIRIFFLGRDNAETGTRAPIIALGLLYQRALSVTHGGDSHRVGGAIAAAGARQPDAKQVRRLLALAVILDGGTRTEGARVGGVGLQIVRDWVLRFNA